MDPQLHAQHYCFPAHVGKQPARLARNLLFHYHWWLTIA